MRRLRILVDMDDTIEHLLDAWIRCLNKRHGTTVKYADVTEWDLCKSFPTLTKEQIYAPLVEDDFWKTVEPMRDAADVLKWAIDEGHEIYIVTATAYETVKSKMENVLFKHFPFISWKNVIIAQNKQMIRGDILVDDAPHNLEGGDYIKLLMTAGHNRLYNAEKNGMYRVDTWQAVKLCICVIAHEDEYRRGLADWRDHPIEFMENWVGVHLYPYQKLLLKSVLGGTN